MYVAPACGAYTLAIDTFCLFALAAVYHMVVSLGSRHYLAAYYSISCVTLKYLGVTLSEDLGALMSHW